MARLIMDRRGRRRRGVTVAGVSSVPSFSVPKPGQVAGTSQISLSKDVAGSSLFGLCVSEVSGSSCELRGYNDVEVQMLPALAENDILSSLYALMDEDSLMMDESNKALNDPNQLEESLACAPRSDGADAFEGLDDLGNLGEEGFNFTDGFSGDYNDGFFLELRDLCTPLSLPDGNKVNQALINFRQPSMVARIRASRVITGPAMSVLAIWKIEWIHAHQRLI